MSQIFPIEADPRFRILTASAGQTVFAITFPFQSNADIKALERSGDEWVEIVGGYTITGAGNPSGGTLTFAVGRAEDEDILILGSAVLERLTSIVLNGRFSSKATDDELDRNRIIQQEVTREVDRAVKTSYGEEAPTLDLGIPDGSVLIKQGLRLTAGPTGAAINSAETFAQQAIAAAGTASSAAGLAVGAAETSVDARDLAQKWASNPEDSVVAGGLYSAFHWAKKAAQVVLDGLVDLSVTTAKIANGAVTQAKLASSFVSGWSSKGTLADADTFLIGDSAASGVAKVSSLANAISSIFNGTRAIANGVFLAASFAWQNAGGFKRTHNIVGHTADRATNWPDGPVTIPAGTLTAFADLGTTTLPGSGTANTISGVSSVGKNLIYIHASFVLSATGVGLLRLGTSGGIVSTGYTCSAFIATTGVAVQSPTTGFALSGQVQLSYGEFITLRRLGNSNKWVISGTGTNAGTGFNAFYGTVTLSDEITQIQITTTAGTSTINSGSVEIKAL